MCEIAESRGECNRDGVSHFVVVVLVVGDRQLLDAGWLVDVGYIHSITCTIRRVFGEHRT